MEFNHSTSYGYPHFKYNIIFHTRTEALKAGSCIVRRLTDDEWHTSGADIEGLQVLLMKAAQEAMNFYSFESLYAAGVREQFNG